MWDEVGVIDLQALLPAAGYVMVGLRCVWCVLTWPGRGLGACLFTRPRRAGTTRDTTAETRRRVACGVVPVEGERRQEGGKKDPEPRRKQRGRAGAATAAPLRAVRPGRASLLAAGTRGRKSKRGNRIPVPRRRFRFRWSARRGQTGHVISGRKPPPLLGCSCSGCGSRESRSVAFRVKNPAGRASAGRRV